MKIIISHKNPDADSIAASLAYADLKKQLGEKVQAKRLGLINNETKFILSFFNIKPPKLIKSVKNKQVILLDHGDSSQSALDLEKAEILEIIDHHYVGDIKTEKPILYRAEPIGSTSSIIFKLFKEQKIKISKKTAGLLLAGIISDTLFLSSPTTTQEDRQIAKKLAKIAQVSAKDLAKKIFKAKSNISGKSAKDIVFGDYKEFKFNKTKFGVGVLETTNPDAIKPMQEKILKLLKTIKMPVFFAVIDILKQNAILYLAKDKEKELAQKAFQKNIKNNIMFLPGVVSRKKQIIPRLAKILT